jgi:hypothetical protein
MPVYDPNLDVGDNFFPLKEISIKYEPSFCGKYSISKSWNELQVLGSVSIVW